MTEVKLKPEVKQLWLDALRSGEYRQGKRALKVGPPDADAVYCCLGVLCEVGVKQGVIPPPVYESLWLYGEGGAYTFPPPEILIWAYGMDPDTDTRDMCVYENPFIGADFLATYNDEHGADFRLIADLIEAHL